MKYSILFLFIVGIRIGWSQTPPDSMLRTIKTPAVEIFSEKNAQDLQRRSTTPGTIVYREEICQKSPEDLGDLTSKFSGVFMRSYGGAGGLKTLNARGLGSTHFLVVNNQQALIFNQMGSANLGELQADGLTAVVFSVGGHDAWDVPTLAKTYSGVLQIKYLELNENQKDLIQIQTVAGSFDRYKLSGSWLKNTKRATFFTQGYGYQMQGNFPFKYQHGQVVVGGNRANNFTREYAGRFGVNIRLKYNNKLQFSAQFLNAFRELPGAIVFYHPDNFQTLGNLQMNSSLRHELNAKKVRLVHYANVSWTKTDYRDSFHLVGPQFQHYRETNADLGQNGSFHSGYFKFNWSAQYIFSTLNTNRADIALPQRHRALFNAGLEYYFHNVKFRMDMPIQAVSDQVFNQVDQNRFLITPSLGLSKNWSMSNHHTTFRASLGQFSRLATFSEMYYGQIGNPNLQPEISQLLNLGLHQKRQIKKLILGFGLDAFYGRIKDKIIAIPTQNLFVWSIRNLQEVRSFGFDAILNLEIIPKNKFSRLQLTQKSSLNVAVDRSNPEAPTYNQQIPYTPYWLHHTELSWTQKKIDVAYGYSFNDFRFVLGENIAANVLGAFQLHDFRLGYTYKLENTAKSSLRIHLKINNLLDMQYQVMRGFPMPGRNFEIGILFK